MKLGIVIPLKSREISRDWKATTRALRCTLDSIVSQSCQDYAVCVAGHERPDFMEDGAYREIGFVSVDFPPPRRMKGEGNRPLVQDKNLKIAHAVKALSGEDIDYWYQLDSDDLLRTDFVEMTRQVEGHAGAVISGGYIMYPGLNRAIPTTEMHLWCGSTSILSDRLINLPDNIDAASIREIPWCRTPHMKMPEFFLGECDGDYVALTDRIIAYTLGSGDNISENWRRAFIPRLKARLEPFLRGRRMSAALRQEFSLRGQ